MSRLEATPSEIQEYLRTIEETPHRIAACTSGREASQLHPSPDNKEWSPVEILAHLRACADVWSHTIYAMLAATNPSLPDLDERRWAKVARYATLDFHSSFRTFASQREELLRVLRDLPEASWSRSALIGGRTHNLFSQVRRMAKHESEHCDQLEALAGGAS